MEPFANKTNLVFYPVQPLYKGDQSAEQVIDREAVATFEDVNLVLSSCSDSENDSKEEYWDRVNEEWVDSLAINPDQPWCVFENRIEELVEAGKSSLWDAAHLLTDIFESRINSSSGDFFAILAVVDPVTAEQKSVHKWYHSFIRFVDGLPGFFRGSYRLIVDVYLRSLHATHLDRSRWEKMLEAANDSSIKGKYSIPQLLSLNRVIGMICSNCAPDDVETAYEWLMEDYCTSCTLHSYIDPFLTKFIADHINVFPLKALKLMTTIVRFKLNQILPYQTDDRIVNSDYSRLPTVKLLGEIYDKNKTVRGIIGKICEYISCSSQLRLVINKQVTLDGFFEASSLLIFRMLGDLKQRVEEKSLLDADAADDEMHILSACVHLLPSNEEVHLSYWCPEFVSINKESKPFDLPNIVNDIEAPFRSILERSFNQTFPHRPSQRRKKSERTPSSALLDYLQKKNGNPPIDSLKKELVDRMKGNRDMLGRVKDKRRTHLGEMYTTFQKKFNENSVEAIEVQSYDTPAVIIEAFECFLESPIFGRGEELIEKYFSSLVRALIIDESCPKQSFKILQQLFLMSQIRDPGLQFALKRISLLPARGNERVMSKIYSVSMYPAVTLIDLTLGSLPYEAVNKIYQIAKKSDASPLALMLNYASFSSEDGTFNLPLFENLLAVSRGSEQLRAALSKRFLNIVKDENKGSLSLENLRRLFLKLIDNELINTWEGAPSVTAVYLACAANILINLPNFINEKGVIGAINDLNKRCLRTPGFFQNIIEHNFICLCDETAPELANEGYPGIMFEQIVQVNRANKGRDQKIAEKLFEELKGFFPKECEYLSRLYSGITLLEDLTADKIRTLEGKIEEQKIIVESLVNETPPLSDALDEAFDRQQLDAQKNASKALIIKMKSRLERNKAALSKFLTVRSMKLASVQENTASLQGLFVCIDRDWEQDKHTITNQLSDQLSWLETKKVTLIKLRVKVNASQQFLSDAARRNSTPHNEAIGVHTCALKAIAAANDRYSKELAQIWEDGLNDLGSSSSSADLSALETRLEVLDQRIKQTVTQQNQTNFTSTEEKRQSARIERLEEDRAKKKVTIKGQNARIEELTREIEQLKKERLQAAQQKQESPPQLLNDHRTLKERSTSVSSMFDRYNQKREQLAKIETTFHAFEQKPSVRNRDALLRACKMRYINTNGSHNQQDYVTEEGNTLPGSHVTLLDKELTQDAIKGVVGAVERVVEDLMRN